MAAADLGTLLPEVKAEVGDGSYAEFELAVNNHVAPMPEPGDDEDVDPKRRRIVVDADVLAYDDDFLSYDDTQSGHLHIQVDVDPWQRIASGSDSVCADEEATDKLVAEARLLDDLETVRVTLKAQIQEGTSCGAKGCGEERAVFDVPAGGSAYDDELQVNCFWWPIPGFEEKDTYARFTDITMYNTQAPAP